MAVTPADELPFTEDDLAPVIDLLARQADRGSGWVNLVPEVQPGEEPAPRNLGALIFANRGEPIPMITWTPSMRVGGRATVGIAHGAGPKGLARLADAGLDLPPGWFKMNDHARRGIVATVPGDADVGDAVHWLLTAGHVLCPAPLTGAWLARSYPG